MKKILITILAFCCIFALASCDMINGVVNGAVNSGNSNNQSTETVANIQQAINDSAPTAASVEVTFKANLGDLKGSYNVTYNDDGSATVGYSYEYFKEISEDSVPGEFKGEKKGTVTVSADGVLSNEIGGVASVEAVTFDITLKEEYFKSVNVASSILRGTVNAANTYDVLGVDIPYDVDLVIFTGSGRVTYITISYQSDLGPIEIKSTYRY